MPGDYFYMKQVAFSYRSTAPRGSGSLTLPLSGSSTSCGAPKHCDCKSLGGCALRTQRGRPRKSLIDLRIERQCIPLAGIELYKSA